MKNRITKLSSFLFFLFIASTSFAQNNLAAGDVAMVSYQSDQDLSNVVQGGSTDYDDRFSIAVLKPGGLAAGTVIYFTDRGWDGPNSTWLDNSTVGHEAVIKWVVPVGGVAQGTEVYFISHFNTVTGFETWTAHSNEAGTISLGTVTSETDPNTDGGGMGFTVAGDELLVYQTGPTGGPAGAYNATPIRFLTALLANIVANSTTSTTWDVTPVTLNESSLPPGLVNGQTAFVMSPTTLPTATVNGTSEPDNGKYNCTNSNGTVCTALALSTIIYTTTNWDYNNAAFAIGATSNHCTTTTFQGEINIQGNSVTIVDGDATPSVTDNTDFGSVSTGGGNIVKSFTIQNTGTTTLTITSITVTGTNSGEFVVSGAPASVAASGSASFNVTFTPGATGTRSAVIHVNNNDCDEADYDFAVQGTGTVATITYYPKTTHTDLSLVSNWTTDIAGGAGTSPTNFTSANQIFDVNRAGNVLNNWTISGGSNLTVSTTSGLVFAAGARFTIGSGSTADFANHSITFRSNATGTASIGTISGTLSNATNVTIERYIPARRAWRFLTAPISATAAPTINASWQEGVTTASGSPNPNPGFGTHITGGTTANGFDQSTGSGASLKTYTNSASATPDQNNWIGVTTSTLTPITGQPGYMLFVRGSRANNLSQGTSAVADNTTLRVTGQLKTGDQTSAVAATGFTVIGNPYASAINLNNIAKTNGSTNIADNYYVWDPKMTGTYGVGAYVNILWNSGTSSYDITPTPVSAVSQFIQSGEAFFAKSTGSAGNLIIKETDKTASGSDNVFRVISPSSTEQKIRTNLYVVNNDGSTSILDGTLNSYSSIFSNAVDKFDAEKLTNFGENIGLVRDGKTLIVERREAIGDPINLKIWQMNQQNYQLEIIAENVDQTNLIAYLQDNYLKTNTPINLGGTTHVKFNITADAASAAENRFVIVFAKPSILVSGNPSISIYPNPVTDGTINLGFNNMPQGNYNIRVTNSAGQTILTKQINHAQGSSMEKLSIKGKKGVLHVEVIKPDNSKFSTKVISY